MNTITGRCSTFGGNSDTGVTPKEGLALVPDRGWEIPQFSHLFVNSPKPDLGTARNLNPAAHYCAMRWDYAKTPVRDLRNAIVRVVAGRGRVVWCHPADWGPHVRTGRVIDLSPGAAKALNVYTDDVVACTLFLPFPSEL